MNKERYRIWVVKNILKMMMTYKKEREMEFIYYDDIKTRRYSILMKAQHFYINLVTFGLRFILMSLTLNLIKDIFIFVREGLALLMSKTINEVHSHPIIHKFLVLYNRTIYTKEPKICRESKP